MKKLLFISVFILFQISTSFAQSGWYAVSNTPVTNDMRCIKFVNTNIGYAACHAGTVAKTTNAGINWVVTSIAPDTINFESIQFLNVNTGYVIGNAKLYKTTNAGMNWSEINTNIWTISSHVYFINENTGFISGLYTTGTFLRKTTNGGKTWEDKTVGGNSGYVGQILFLNENTGFVVKENKGIYKTTNEGNSWDSVSSWIVTNIQFPNESTGYGVGTNGSFIKTTNGGNGWLKITLPLLPLPFNVVPELYSVNFVSGLTGFVCGVNGYIGKTTNGGNNWTVQSIANTGLLNSITMTSPETGCAVGVKGSILTTTNGGVNWNKQYNGSPEAFFRGVYSVDSLTTFAVTDDVYLSGSRIYSTTNGGLSWVYKNSGYFVSLNDIEFTSANTGFIVGDSNRVLKTTNGGDNWVLKTPSLVQNRLHAIFFVNPSTGYISGRYGWNGEGAPLVMRTVNGGENWTTLQIPDAGITARFYGDLFFLNADTGFVCGNVRNGNICRTTNRGLNWTIINTGFTSQQDYVHSVYFTSASTGYIVGNHYDQALNMNSGKVLKTTNGGLNWVNIPLPENIAGRNKFFHVIRFVNPNTGYMTGNRTGMIKTTDAGNTWFREALIAPAVLYGLSFLNGNHGYAVGEGIILKTSPLTDIEPVNNFVANDYLLYQNYPNPFNPVTQIKYNLPKAGFVSLRIFDILGKEVARLVNEYNQPGTYEINWNASQYPSGIYFYKLASDDFSQVKKMILLK